MTIPKTILIATTKKGKLNEFKEALKDLKFNFLTLKDINFPKIQPKENGKTFKENSIIKARFYGKRANLMTLSDDSGLLVDALPNKLGIKTKRYAKGTDKNRYKKLLKKMVNVPRKERKARFISAVTFYNPKTDKLVTTQGICDGKIAFKPQGLNGFGYDPIFIVKELNKHFAELTLEEKNKISHRAKALEKMKKYLFL